MKKPTVTKMSQQEMPQGQRQVQQPQQQVFSNGGTATSG